jgi:hypothetical protein
LTKGAGLGWHIKKVAVKHRKMQIRQERFIGSSETASYRAEIVLFGYRRRGRFHGSCSRHDCPLPAGPQSTVPAHR